MPLQGVGIGLRREFWDEALSTERRIDWFEIITENFIRHGGRADATLDRVVDRFSVGAHGVSMSIGGPDPLDAEHLQGVAQVCRRIGASEYTEHLCWSGAHSAFFHDLLPLPFSEEAVHHAARRAREVSDRLELPLLLENVSYYARMPGSTLSEAEFVTAVLDEADCGLLLDVNNVYVNALNHGTDPLADLLALPLHRTGRIHIAGHVHRDHLVVDNHGAPVVEPVFELLAEALTRTGPVPVLLEWDLDIPSLDRVLDEAEAVRAVFDRATSGHVASQEA